MKTWTTLAKYAKRTKLSHLICMFLIIQILVSLPLAINLIKNPPSVSYTHTHGGPVFSNFSNIWAGGVIFTSDESGFVRSMYMIDAAHFYDGNFLGRIYETYDAERDRTYVVEVAPFFSALIIEGTPLGMADYAFAITPEYIFFRDAHSSLFAPTSRIPTVVLENMDYEELFNHIVRYNNYFVRVLAPIYLQTTLIFFLLQIVLYAIIIWLQWKKLSDNMTLAESFAVCAVSSVPAGVSAFIFGLILPVTHIMFFQLLMIYFSYKTTRNYNRH